MGRKHDPHADGTRFRGATWRAAGLRETKYRRKPDVYSCMARTIETATGRTTRLKHYDRSRLITWISHTYVLWLDIINSRIIRKPTNPNLGFQIPRIQNQDFKVRKSVFQTLKSSDRSDIQLHSSQCIF